VGAVASIARSRFRQNRRSFALLVALVAVAVALVLAAVAGARRTSSAVSEFVASTQGADGFVAFAVEGGVTSVDLSDEEREVAAVDGVAATARFVFGAALLSGPSVPTGELGLLAHVPIDDDALPMIARAHVVDGRLPDQSAVEELLIDEELSRDASLGVGSRVDLLVPTPAQLGGQQGFDEGGLAVDAEVVGIVRRPGDLRDPQEPQLVPNDYTTHPNVFVTAAVWQAAGGDVGVLNPFVAFDVESGEDPAAVLADVADATGAYPVSPKRFLEIEGTYNGVERSADLHAGGMRAFALVLTLAALFIVGQTLGRQVVLESRDEPTLVAIGMTPGELTWSAVLRATPVAVAGGLLGLAGAVALSPLAPLPGTVARRADPDAGFGFDAAILLPGVTVAVALVLLVALWSIRRAAGLRRRPSAPRGPTLASRLAGRGLPPPAVIGVRFALEPGSGPTAVPTRTAVAVGIATVALVMAAVTFAVSLDATRDEPRRYGVTWDVAAGAMSTPEEVTAMAEEVAAIPGVEAFTGAYTTAFDTDFGEVPAFLLQAQVGEVTPLITSGRAPGEGEIAIGALTMAENDLEIGDELLVADSIAGTHGFTIVGEVVLNVAGLDVSIPPGRGMLLDWSALALLAGDQASFLAPSAFLVDAAPGETAAVEESLRELFPTSTQAAPVEPLDLTNVGDASALPTVLGAVVATLGFGAVAHALLSAVRRRRHELAVLKTIGFVRVQTRAAVAIQAATFGIISLAVGIPLGIAGGRAAWAATAGRLGIESHPVVSPTSVVLVALVGVLSLAVLSLVPAQQALRVPAAATLREP
jgi:ABC-type lipoprotein release transport system permease subunit